MRNTDTNNTGPLQDNGHHGDCLSKCAFIVSDIKKKVTIALTTLLYTSKNITFVYKKKSANVKS